MINNSNETETNAYEVMQPEGNGPISKKRRKPGKKLIAGLLIASLLTNAYLVTQVESARRYARNYYNEWDYYAVTTAEDYGSEYDYMDMDALLNIASYMKSEDIRDICFTMIDSGYFDINATESLAPYMKSEHIKDIVIYAVENGLVSTAADVSFENGGVTIMFQN